MTDIAAEKMTAAFTMLLEAHRELRETLAQECRSDTARAEDGQDVIDVTEFECALITEIKAALETVMARDGVTSASVANVISSIKEALDQLSI